MIGAAIFDNNRSNNCLISWVCFKSPNKITNSSPPKRATVSSVRTVFKKRWAITFNRMSPAA
ncbi:MAG: hypothetical protein Q9M50_00885 [Methylococcales bacterium]|nr:hypothetical protein [Methylococcales bacterium]